MSSKNDPDGGTSPRFSLAARLTAWYGASAFLLLALATGFLYWALIANLDREDDEFLADKIHILRSLLQDRPEDSRMLREEVEWEPAARQFGLVYVRILDGEGRSILETPGMSQRLPSSLFPDAGAAEAEPRGGAEIDGPEGGSFRVVSARAAPSRPGLPGNIIQIGLDRTREEALLTGYRRYLWFALGMSLIVCILAGYQIAHQGLRPLAAITAAARRIRSSTLHERIEPARLPAELAVLAATFNDMLDRLQDSFDRLARFSADIAHELRNPVSNLRGEAEVALGQPRSPEEYRQVLGSCLEECGRLAHLIDSLLFLARAENPRTQIARESLDVGKELAVVREFYEAAAAESGVRLLQSAGESITASLDRTLFQRALGNLVANALAHTPRGGTVTLSAARQNGGVRVEVSDNGSGIPPEHLDHVFDRFYRADPARTNALGRVGLGLAIVKSIACLHGGSAEITSAAGGGTRVTLLFPPGPDPRSGPVS